MGFISNQPIPRPAITPGLEPATDRVSDFQVRSTDEVQPLTLADLPDTPDALRITIAALEQDNTVYGLMAKGFTSFEAEEGYDPANDPLITEDPRLKLYQDELADSESRLETQHIISAIEREIENRKILANAGGFGLAVQLGAGILDPLFLALSVVTGGGAAGIKAVSLGAKIAKYAAIGGGSEAAAEVVKQSFQYTRTWEETAFNIGGATVFSAMFGAGAWKFSNAQRNKMEKVIDDFIGGEDDVLAGSWGVDKLVPGAGIAARNSPSVEIREVTELLSESTQATKKNLRGQTTGDGKGDVETRLVAYDARLYKALVGLDESYLDYKKLKNKGSTEVYPTPAGRGKREGKPLSRKEFNVEAGKASRRNDQHPNPQVAATAKKFRDEIFDPMEDAAIELDIFKEGVDLKTAKSYFTRVYNTGRIAAKRDEWDNILFRWLDKDRTNAKAKLSRLVKPQDVDIIKNIDKTIDALEKTKEGATESFVKDVNREINKLKKQKPEGFDKITAQANVTDEEIKDAVNNITGHILGTPGGRLTYDKTVTLSGSFKGRRLAIADEAIEDFLESDIEIVSRMYMKSVAPDIELTRAFGSVDMKDQMKAINKDFARLRENAKKITNKKAREKKLLALDKRERDDIKRIEGMRDRLRGTRGQPSDPDSGWIRAAKTIKLWNYLSKFGSMALNSIGDVGGMFFANGLMPVVESIAGIARNPAKIRMASNQMKEWAIGLDLRLNTRASQLSDVGAEYARTSKFERGVATVAEDFSKVTLMSHWNAFVRQVTGSVTMHRIIRDSILETGGKLSKARASRLRTARVTPEMSERIATQMKKHGDGEGGFNLPNGGEWDDQGAYEVLQGATVRDTNKSVLIPGVGDKPLFVDANELASMWGQGKSFMFAAQAKILIPAIQHKDAAVLAGIIVSTTGGALSFVLNELMKGNDIPTDPKKILIEGVDKSGVPGTLMEVNNLIGKFTRNSVNLHSLAGVQKSSRYASRNLPGAIGGMSMGSITDLATVAGAITTRDVSRGDIHSARKVMFWQNVFYLRQPFNLMEEKVADVLVTE